MQYELVYCINVYMYFLTLFHPSIKRRCCHGFFLFYRRETEAQSYVDFPGTQARMEPQDASRAGPSFCTCIRTPLGSHSHAPVSALPRPTASESLGEAWGVHLESISQEIPKSLQIWDSLLPLGNWFQSRVQLFLLRTQKFRDNFTIISSGLSANYTLYFSQGDLYKMGIVIPLKPPEGR